MVKSKFYILTKEFDGEPKKSDIKLIEEELRPIQDGEYIAEALYISVDPYMRIVGTFVGDVLSAAQVARIIESKNKDFPKGRLVVGYFGWRTHTVVEKDFFDYYVGYSGIKRERVREALIAPYLLPDIGNLPPSLAFGMLGMPGHTSYTGVEFILNPKPGEVLYVSGAAGAVGSHVGQLAKIAGSKVIGSAGSDEKCKWLVNELGFDHAFNYKTTSLDSVLKEHAPQGLDMYFDNVGDNAINVVIDHMNQFGRIAVCGAISHYNVNFLGSDVKVDLVKILFKTILIAGVNVYRYLDIWTRGIEHNLNYIKEGKLKYKEHVTEGFDNIFDAFLGVLRGENIGKAVVKVKA